MGLMFVPLYVLLRKACVLMPGALFGILNGAALFWIGFALLTVLLVLPYLFGILQLAFSIMRGEDAVLADVFLPFSSFHTYGTAVLQSLSIFWKLWVTFDLAAGICYVTAKAAPGNLFAAVIATLLVICEVLLGILWCLMSFPKLYVKLKTGGTPAEKRGYAKKMSRACPSGGAMFFLGYVPRLVLGVLTFGILLLTDVFPGMCVAYFRYCEKIEESMIQSEEMIDE